MAKRGPTGEKIELCATCFRLAKCPNTIQQHDGCDLPDWRESEPPAELRIELGNVVAQLKEQDGRIDSVVRVLHERLDGLSERIGRENCGSEIEALSARVAALETRMDARAPGGSPAPEPPPPDPREEWPKVTARHRTAGGNEWWEVEGEDCFLTRAQADDVVRAYTEMVRQATGKVLCLNLRTPGDVMDHARRVLKGE